jgi:hypothetical protein
VRDRLGEFRWSKQREILEAVVRHRYVAVKSAHDTGKSMEPLGPLHGGLISRQDPFATTTAPTTKQVHAILWRYIGQAHRKGNLAGRITLDDEWYMGPGGKELVAFGRKPADHDPSAGVALLFTSVSPANAAGQAITLHVIAGGYADVIGSTCPFTTDRPSTDVTCELWALKFAQERIGSNADKAVWRAFLFRARYVLHADGTCDTLYVASGVADAPNSFDKVKLTKAGVTASISLDDGSEQSVSVAWDGTNSPLQVSGNNGLLNTDSPRHIVTRCFTENRNSHQKYRTGVRATGTIDGTDVTTFPYLERFSPLLYTPHRQRDRQLIAVCSIPVASPVSLTVQHASSLPLPSGWQRSNGSAGCEEF